MFPPLNSRIVDAMRLLTVCVYCFKTQRKLGTYRESYPNQAFALYLLRRCNRRRLMASVRGLIAIPLLSVFHNVWIESMVFGTRSYMKCTMLSIMKDNRIRSSI